MSEKEPKVSVIVPIYSVEKYLQKCLDTICNQTYPYLEIILVDDGSPDHCGDICEEYSMMDSRIVVIHKENGGLSSARNTGLDAATGMYVAFVDADDAIHPQFVEILVKMCVQYGCDIAQCDYLAIAEDSILPPQNPWRDILFYDGRQALHELCKGGVNAIKYTVAWNKVYRKELFDGIRYPVGKIHEDEFTTYQVMWKAQKVAVTKQYLYYYLQRDTGIMGECFSVKRLDSLEAFRERLLFLDQRGLREDYIQTLHGLLSLLEENYRRLQKCMEGKEKLCSQLLIEKENIEKHFPVMSEKSESEKDFVPWSLKGKGCPYSQKSKILLYGAGKWGRIYYKWIEENKHGIVVGWVDNAWYSLRQEDLPIDPLDSLLRVSYDYVLIAITNAHIQEEVVRNLIYWKVPKEKILIIPS